MDLTRAICVQSVFFHSTTVRGRIVPMHQVFSANCKSLQEKLFYRNNFPWLSLFATFTYLIFAQTVSILLTHGRETFAPNYFA